MSDELTREQIEDIQKAGVNIFVVRDDELYLSHEPRHRVHAKQSNVVKMGEYAHLRAQLAACQEEARCNQEKWENAVGAANRLQAKVTALEQDNKRLDVENNQLWAVFKTCHGCKYVVPGVMFGCPIQHHIDLSGNCNQYEKDGE